MRTRRITPPPLKLRLDHGLDLAGIADKNLTARQPRDELESKIWQLISFIDDLQVEQLMMRVEPGPLCAIGHHHAGAGR
jgi:hypothetical protein